jgi:hypothetical protein
MFFEAFFASSIIATLVFRWWLVVGESASISLLAILAARFYKHLLLTGRDLRFQSVAMFWVLWVTLFGLLYMALYNLAPTLVTFQHPVFVPSPTLVSLSLLETLRLKLYFVAYSACVSTATSFPTITSNSVIVSILNVVETIGSILFVGLIVATFAGKAIAGKHK